VFAVQKDEEGEEVRICVDGKQRLTSIQKFIDGQVRGTLFWVVSCLSLPLSCLAHTTDSSYVFHTHFFVKRNRLSTFCARVQIETRRRKRISGSHVQRLRKTVDWKYQNVGGKSFQQSKLPVVGSFLSPTFFFLTSLVICVVEYFDLTPGSEREIFQRVQLGMTLTVAGQSLFVFFYHVHTYFITRTEKLQAISSPWAEWISDLETRHVLADGGLSTVLQWDTKRGRDFQCIAQFVYCCDGLPDHLFPTAPKMEKWLCRVDKPTQAFQAIIGDVLTEFWVIATTEDWQYGFKNVGKRLAPIEFVFVGTLHGEFFFILHTLMAKNKRSPAIRPTQQPTRRSGMGDFRNAEGDSRQVYRYPSEFAGDEGTLDVYQGVGEWGEFGE
jgi:hypothetical protein